MLFPHQVHFVQGVEAETIRMMQSEGSEIPFFTRKLLIRHGEAGKTRTEIIWLYGESIEELQVIDTPLPEPTIPEGDDPFA